MKSFVKKILFILTALTIVLKQDVVRAETNPYQWQEGQDRIIAGTKVLAEITEALEVPLVGITSHQAQDLPKSYQDLPQVGSGPRIDYEVIASLEADYYLTSSSFEQMTRKELENIKVTPVYYTYSRYEDIYKTIQKLGQDLGKADKADSIIKEMSDKEAQVLKDTGDLAGKKVFVLFGSTQRLTAASRDLFMGSLVEKLGMVNVADEFIEDGVTHAELSTEAIIKQNPDYIIVYTLSSDFNLGESDDISIIEDMLDEEFSQEIWQETNAVKNNQVIYLTSNDVPVQAGMKAVDYLDLVKNSLLDGGSLNVTN